jgi:hypothetical protein
VTGRSVSYRTRYVVYRGRKVVQADIVRPQVAERIATEVLEKSPRARLSIWASELARDPGTGLERWSAGRCVWRNPLPRLT